MDAPSILAEHAPAVDRLLDAVLPAAEAPPRGLHAAMRHLVFPGGKRLRPVLAMASAQALGAPASAALPAAAAVELIHTYSLIHDDLPCMDDDVERRGRPTVHVVHGEALAVLAGDALQALAFEVLASAGAPGASEEPGRRREALRRLARAAGARDLVGGQADDLGAGAAPLAASDVEWIHERKSAALIGASMATGALLAGADDEGAERLDRAGRRLGVAFQIADDLLDAETDEGPSLARLLGAREAARRAETLLDESLAMFEDWGARAEALRQLARYCVRRDR